MKERVTRNRPSGIKQATRL